MGNELLPFAAIWISVAHSLQYLWITAYYAKRSQAHERTGPYLWKTLVAGLAVTNAPILLFAPDLLGTLPWDAGLAMTTFSMVNIHHFILDGAIWKLRDGGIARVLLRPSTTPAAAPVARSSGSKVRPLIWGVAGLALIVQGLVVYEGLGIVQRSHSRARELRYSGVCAGSDASPWRSTWRWLA